MDSRGCPQRLYFITPTNVTIIQCAYPSTLSMKIMTVGLIFLLTGAGSIYGAQKSNYIKLKQFHPETVSVLHGLAHKTTSTYQVSIMAQHFDSHPFWGLNITGTDLLYFYWFKQNICLL